MLRNPSASRHLRSIVAATLVACSTLAPGAAASRDFVWKVTGKQSAIYLVGSVHMLTKDYYPLSAALEAAFKDSDLLLEEVDLAEMQAPDSQFQILMRGMLPADQSLDKVVSAATVAQVSKRVSDLGL